MDYKHDFYSGYEGEPEYVFRLLGAPTRSIRTWGGYFDAIMKEVTPGPNGWESLAKTYHLDEGWFDESPWGVPDVARAHSQLESVRSGSLDETVRAVHSALCALFLHALTSGDRVIIEYD